MKAAQKLERNCSYHISSITLRIHTNTCTTWYSLQRFFIHKWWSMHNYNSKPFNPALTILEEGASGRIYTKYRPSTSGGVKFLMESDEISWGRVHQCRTEAKLSLLVNRGADWANTWTHKLTHQSTELPGEPTCVEQRGRAQFPIKDAEVQLSIYPDHLLQSRISQIQSIWLRSDWFQSNWMRIH